MIDVAALPEDPDELRAFTQAPRGDVDRQALSGHRTHRFGSLSKAEVRLRRDDSQVTLPEGEPPKDKRHPVIYRLSSRATAR